jgi:alpha-amylase
MSPLRFVIGLHLHQPVGNFDHVFSQHLDDVYRPLLDQLEKSNLFPAVLHLSGPLLEWLETNEPAYLDRLAGLARSGRLELLLSGFHEPILAALPRTDRVEQVRWMREAIARRFGVDATSLWLTERVWEPELAADLSDAGVDAVLLDDRHFLVAGFGREQLHTWYLTESDGKRVGVFPIDERLRYLIPFRPPEETAEYLRGLHRAGHAMALLADDGEKFGGWPGTKAWVYEQGWFDRFGVMIRTLVDEGSIVLSTLADVLHEVPCGGLAYLPTASYREMEGWALPPDPQRRLAALEEELGTERIEGPEGGLVRGSHWRHFLVKYPESNRLQKMMVALSALCRVRGDPADVRRAVARAQCNDAYWHGVFGGLYLPHLRNTLWNELVRAESLLRRDEALTWEEVDLDSDGAAEIWVHGAHCSVVVAPARGGAIEVLSHFAAGTNYADVLTRRREAYHDEALARGSTDTSPDRGGTASIHDIEQSLRLEVRPAIDPHDRAIGVDRLLPADATAEGLEAGAVIAARSWARERMRATVRLVGDEVRILLAAADTSLVKELRISPDGSIVISWRWTPSSARWFATELSLAAPLQVVAEPMAELVTYPIETVAKSEKGFDRTRQGESLTFLWPASQGAAQLIISPAH